MSLKLKYDKYKINYVASKYQHGGSIKKLLMKLLEVIILLIKYNKYVN
jgi:hypothetical protein